MSRVRTLGIAGVGLIGASIGLRAAAAGYVVHGWDTDPANLACAKERGAISVVSPDVETLGRDVETLVIAAPLGPTVAMLEAFAAEPPRASLVIDVASVKAQVAAAGRGLAAFVATHPIAGSERSGPAAADAVLFVDRVWTVDPAAAPEALALARSFVAEMGARAIAIDSLEHDRVIALTSHLPQVLAVALGSRLDARIGDAHVADLCGTGMASMTRLGSSSWAVWEAIVLSNRSALAQEVRGLADVLFSLAENLEANRTHDLAVAFAASASAVARLNANGSAVGRVEVRKNVSDER